MAVAGVSFYFLRRDQIDLEVYRLTLSSLPRLASDSVPATTAATTTDSPDIKQPTNNNTTRDTNAVPNSNSPSLESIQLKI